MSYTNYVNSSFDYVEGEIKDPKKIAWRRLMQQHLDEMIPEQETTYREMIIRGTEEEKRKALSMLFKPADLGGKDWSKIPPEYRNAYIQLFFEERKLHESLDLLGAQ